MLNQKAPHFSELKKYLDSKKYNFLVLYFYPKDNTPSCTKEACSIRDNFAELEKSKIKIIGVSPDSSESHDKFKTKYELPFQLIPDEDKSLATSYGVWGEKSMYGRKYFGILRKTFIIDSSGKIIRVIDKVDTANHANQILDEMKNNKIF
ncbi:peroxiredoxin [Candidatus Pacearchaeota archaeon CG10_big_fil_rev_8_21_14_0_10_32_14]|nr:MAG: peroxiredoxin [Candidatus Pacearchaeota archaeon CG10_big_fil_rev_8_21_14_0_10_32_14]